MRTRSDFKTAAEHIAYTQGIIDAGRERIPMTEYERADLRLRAIVEANNFGMDAVIRGVKGDGVLEVDARHWATAWLAFALKPENGE